MTKRQRKREHVAQLCDKIGGPNNRSSAELRAINRRVDKSKRAQFLAKQGGEW